MSNNRKAHPNRYAQNARSNECHVEASHVQFNCGHTVWIELPDHPWIEDCLDLLPQVVFMLTNLRAYDCPWCGGEAHISYADSEISTRTLGQFKLRMSRDLSYYDPVKEPERKTTWVLGRHNYCDCPEPS